MPNEFVELVLTACKKGFLQKGDYLICDNAMVHCASEAITALKKGLVAFDIELVFLPAYSPKLNPSELVFSLCKGTL
jgi:transposase